MKPVARVEELEWQSHPTAKGVEIKLTIVFDNRTLDPHLVSGWGYACLVDADLEDNGEAKRRLLFDTGADGRALLANMEHLGIDPTAIEAIVLSHPHGDHTGGLQALLSTGVRPTVYVPRSFPRRFKRSVRSLTTLVEVHEPAEIWPGVRTTGEVGRGIVEQALAVDTDQGMVVVTGCAHPGVVQMVRRARETREGEVALVMGGFHLGGAGRDQVGRVIAELRRLGVQKVAPCHCTGDRAMRMFSDAFGADYISVGVGKVIHIAQA